MDEKLRKYKREQMRKSRAEIKANPKKYAEYLAKVRKWCADARARRTPEQKERIRLANMKWRQEHRERDRLNKRNHRLRLRKEIIMAYGGKCICCGEDRIEFLSIDHIGGGGNKHRKSLGRTGCQFYYWLRWNNYPKNFRVLCYNCNQSFGHYGYSPNCPNLSR
jgi:hypothetical protein